MGLLSLFLKEVLPMVADISTLTSFVVLALMKMSTIPFLFDWLTRLKYMSRIIRGFFYNVLSFQSTSLEIYLRNFINIIINIAHGIFIVNQ